jgi:hypothetical protein
MTGHRLTFVLSAAVIVLVASPARARIDVKIDFDKSFNFKTVKTWSFDPDGSGDVRMARTMTDDPVAAKRVADPIIVDAVGVEMTKLRLASASNPDISIRYYLLLVINQTAQTMGQFLPSTVAWGLPPFAQATQSLELMNQGALVLDLSAGGKVVWRGVAQAKVKFDVEPKKRNDILRQAVHQLLRRFPPKQ